MHAVQPAAVFPGLFPDAEVGRRILGQTKVIPPWQVLRHLVPFGAGFHGFPPALGRKQRGVQMLFPIKQLGGMIVVHVSIGQQPDMPLVGPPGEAGFKAQAPAGQAVPFRVALKEKRIVKQDFSIVPNAHANQKRHFFKAVFPMNAFKTEYRFQGAGRFQLAAADFAGQKLGLNRAVLRLFVYMAYLQHRENPVKRLHAPPKAADGDAVSRWGNRQADFVPADRPALRRFPHR